MLTKRESVSANVYVITVKIFKHSEIIEMFNSNLLKKKTALPDVLILEF